MQMADWGWLIIKRCDGSENTMLSLLFRDGWLATVRQAHTAKERVGCLSALQSAVESWLSVLAHV